MISRVSPILQTSADADCAVWGLAATPLWHNDCACEAGNVETMNVVEDTLPYKAIPHQCPDLYQDADTLPGQYILFNPIAGIGVSVLNAAAQQILEMVNGRTTIGALVQQMEESGIATATQGRALLLQMQAVRLIYTGSAPPQPVPRPPLHLGVWLHVTNQCNLRCTYCYLDKTNERLALTRGQRALDAVFDAARTQGMQHLTLKYAGGEALLEAPLIWALDDYARQQADGWIAVQSVILTNGTRLAPKILAEIKARGFGLAISLDGLGAAHDEQRPLLGGQPSFAKVVQGIAAARAAGVPLNISVVVGPSNLPTLPALIDYLLDHDLHFSLSFLRDNDLAQVGLMDQADVLIEGMQAAYARIAARPPRFSLMDSALDRVQLTYPHFAACGLGESYLVIKHTGEVASCQMHLNRPVGHIRQGQVLSLVAQHTRERPIGTTIDDHTGCSTCQWRYRCAGGCPIVTFQTTGRFDARSPFCGVYKALIPAQIALEGRRVVGYGVAMRSI